MLQLDLIEAEVCIVPLGGAGKVRFLTSSQTPGSPTCCHAKHISMPHAPQLFDQESNRGLTLSQYSMKSFSADHSASCVALCASSSPQMLGHSAAQESTKARMPKILTAMSRRWSQRRFRQRVQTFGDDGGGGRDRMVGKSGRGPRCAAVCVAWACASWPVRAVST